MPLSTPIRELVIPAKAGIQGPSRSNCLLDTGFRRYDEIGQATETLRPARTASTKAAGSVTGAEHCGPMQT
jgi:hypothetical protein